MTPDEARALVIRDAAGLLRCSPDAAAPFVTEIATRDETGMPPFAIRAWMASNLMAGHPAARPNFVDAVLKRLHAPSTSDIPRDLAILDICCDPARSSKSASAVPPGQTRCRGAHRRRRAG
ncbi:hypothetical protein [Amycolatopsis sp. TNS106]|uniref:hypothetical protein n=1 Tax=Amycolatopsis sp. TNS106 TaxID=2861750 RepID=UPI001C5A1B64|nr:hypothetical protein [Amycolatopsis sp. TNS106]QXV63525.1 hypothetical protein CVV72_40915 [Amycolatopsis sp. TNS106]